MSHRTSLPLVVVALLAALCVSVAAPASADQPPPDPPSVVSVYLPSYLDVDEASPFTADIRALAATGITKGCGQSNRFFCGTASVTRGQMAAFLGRGLDLDDGTGAPRFVDTGTSVFADDIARLAAAGITKGCNPPANDRFCPDQPITRGQMAAFLVRALDLGQPLPVDSAAMFADDDDSPFQDDIARLAMARITRGCNPPGNDRFCPDKPVTRQQMAAFLVRALDLPPVPVHPSYVSVTRKVTTDPVGSIVTVCPLTDGATLDVRNAGWGMTYPTVDTHIEPSVLEWSAGSYDAVTDVWTTGSFTQCVTFASSWNPRDVALTWPLSELRITSPFGFRFHPIFGNRRMHTGTDFGAASGTPVSAAASGTVVTASSDGGYGNTVGIRHAAGLTTRYSHLSSISVRVGDTVSAGDTVGRVGCTGTCTGPHLHFETWEWGIPVNPMLYLDL